MRLYRHFFYYIMKIIATSAVLLIFISSAFSQHENPSAMSASFGISFPSNNVGLSTGALSVSIPIDDNPFIPISLSYTATGHKVSQRSGVVGLGWNISTDAYIVREVRSIPDDAETGYSGNSPTGAAVNSTLNGEKVYKFFHAKIDDSEPDIFHYQFLGYGGSFIITEGRQAIKFNDDDLKIEPFYSNTLKKYTGFNVWDGNGNKYSFFVMEDMGSAVNGGTPNTYTYKWYLSAVNYYETNKNLIFNYETYGQVSESHQYRRAFGTTSLSINTDNVVNTRTPRYLRSIVYDDFKIEYQYGSSADFTNARRLNSIFFYRYDKFLYSYDLSYSYFTSSNTHRLKLKRIRKNRSGSPSLLVASFNYYGEGIGEFLLPPHQSYQQDHWGYFNNNQVSSLFSYQNANRNPSLAHTKACVLKRVNYPTGGYEEYDYELNTYRLSNQNHFAGGLRIKKIDRFDGVNTISGSVYSYDLTSGVSSGQIYAQPIYSRQYILQILSSPLTYTQHVEHSFRALTDIYGRHVVYSKVTEILVNGSTIVNDFFNFSDDQTEMNYFPSIYKITYNIGGTNVSNLSGHNTILGYNDNIPWGYHNVNGSKAGLSKLTRFKNNADQEEKLIEFFYTKFYNGTQRVGYSNSLAKFISGTPNTVEMYIGKYFIRPYYFKLNKQITHTSDPQNPSSKIVEVNDIAYNSSNRLPSINSSYLQNQSGEKIHHETFYLIDEPVSTVQTNAVTHNLTNVVVRTISKKNTEQRARADYNYVFNAGKVRLDRTIQRGRSSSPIFSDQSLTYQNGVPVQVLDNILGDVNSVIFDDLYMSPIAQVQNSNFNNAAYTGFELGQKGNWTFQNPLKYDENCYQEYMTCVNNCDFSQCYDDCELYYYNQCLSLEVNVNQNDANTGKYSYNLSKGKITKSNLSTGAKYILSYWRKSGTVSINGVNSNVLKLSRTINNWIYEERELNVTNSTIEVSGNAIIDDLRLYPINARMETSTYNIFDNHSSQTDENNMSGSVELDGMGRFHLARDYNKDILKRNAYNILPYGFSETEFVQLPSTSGSFSLNLFSNTTWAIGNLPSWLSVNSANGSNDSPRNFTYQQNTGSVRSANITLTSPNFPTKNIVVNQQAAPPYINVSQSYLEFSFYDDDPQYFNISSNTNWSISVTYYDGQDWLYFFPPVGSGNAQITIGSSNLPYYGSNWYALLTITGGGITRYVNVYAYGY